MSKGQKENSAYTNWYKIKFKLLLNIQNVLQIWMYKLDDLTGKVFSDLKNNFEVRGYETSCSSCPKSLLL